jgi:hypothetical protein
LLAKFVKKPVLITLEDLSSKMKCKSLSAPPIKATRISPILIYLEVGHIDCQKVMSFNSKKLTGHSIADNSIKTEEGVAMLEKFLAANTSLTVLDIECNNFGDDNAEILKQSLGKNMSIEQVPSNQNQEHSEKRNQCRRERKMSLILLSSFCVFHKVLLLPTSP